MELREFTKRRITSKLSQRILGIGVLVVGAAMIVFGQGQYQRVVTIGLLYTLLAVGVLVVDWAEYIQPNILTVWQLVTLVLTVMFTFVLVTVVWRRSTYQPLNLVLVYDVLPVVVTRFLKLVPVGMFIVIGFAEGPKERVLAVPPLIIWVVFIILIELLSGYQGFGWPVFPLVLTAVWLVLVSLAGVPLYVLGVSMRERGS